MKLKTTFYVYIDIYSPQKHYRQNQKHYRHNQKHYRQKRRYFKHHPPQKFDHHQGNQYNGSSLRSA